MVGVNVVEIVSDLIDSIGNISHVITPELKQRVVNHDVEAAVSRV